MGDVDKHLVIMGMTTSDCYVPGEIIVIGNHDDPVSDDEDGHPPETTYPNDTWQLMVGY
jgi:hypothetical protein